MRLSLTRSSPLIGAAGAVLDDAERADLVAALAPEALAAGGRALNRGPAGQTLELPLDAHPMLAVLAERLETLVGLENTLTRLFRLRWAGPGDSHPLHTDDYEIDGARLWITALVYLTEVEGGRTAFPDAVPPLEIAPRAGHAVAWFNQGADGAADPRAEHEFTAVEAGARLTLTWFVYATPQAATAAWKAAQTAEPKPLLGYLEAPPKAPGTLAEAQPGCLYCVDESVPSETIASLRRACAARGVGFVRVQADEVPADRGPLPVGAMLYTPATSINAERVEQQLWQPGVASFHRRAEGPFVSTLNPLMAYARAGLPVPRFGWIRSRRRAEIRAVVDALGGLPLVLKAGPGEGGVGTLRADSLPALYSLVDLLISQRGSVQVLAYVPDALHLRLVVVGDEVVSAYRNPTELDDFRSAPSDDAGDYDIAVEAEWAEVAVRATQVIGYAFAGVDLLVHPSGRIYLLEANFPCYFPQAEEFGADVSGAMVDFLVERAAMDIAGPDR